MRSFSKKKKIKKSDNLTNASQELINDLEKEFEQGMDEETEMYYDGLKNGAETLVSGFFVHLAKNQGTDTIKQWAKGKPTFQEIESDTDINFLPKPKFHPERLKYIKMKEPIEIYVNLYEIKLSKQIKLFQYPFTLDPEPEKDKDKIIKIIIKNCYRELKAIFKNFCIFNRELYTEEEIKEVKTIKTSIFLKNKRVDFAIELIL